MSTALETGSVASAGVTLNGAFGGSEDLNLTFVPQMAGTIGSTPGLLVDVFDASGTRVTTLDVGSTYTPGSKLELADGVSIAFSGGQLDPASGDRFETRLVADSDSSDILVAAGLGGFFVGTDARSMDVDPALLANPDMFAAALGGSPGDNRNLLTFAGIYENASDDLDGKSPDDFYRLLLTEIGSETARSNQTLETQEILLSSLDARREEISGVNVDEELLEIEKFQQLYSAAARFLQTMQEVNDVLINL
jgi:flagellar hook-associated protein 1 FlgK